MSAAARRLVWVAALLVLAVALLGLTACGGDEQAVEPDPAARAAVVSAARGAGAAAARVDGQLEIKSEGVSLTLPFRAASDPKIPTSDTTVDVSDALEASGLSGANGEVRLILIRDQLWLKVAQLSQRLGAKEWIHLRTDQLDELGVAGADELLQSIQQSSGDTWAGAFEGAGEDFGTVGTEEIDGVQTTHYKGTIDLDAALAKATPEQRKTLEQALTNVSERTLPAEAWVDGDGNLRRLILSYKVEAGGQTGEGRVLVNLKDFGSPITVTPPPADAVTDISEIVPG